MSLQTFAFFADEPSAESHLLKMQQRREIALRYHMTENLTETKSSFKRPGKTPN